MKQTKKLIAVLFLVLASFANSKAQSDDVSSKINYIFHPDSIDGFDEQNANVEALSYALYGQEYKYFMYNQKRNFIIQKYNIKVAVQKTPKNVQPFPAKYGMPSGIPNKSSSLLTSSGACSNEDFEDAQINSGPQIGGAVNGWVITAGTGANYCAPSALNATALYTVFNAPTVDNYMVSPSNTISSYFDATSINQPAGNCFIRINDATAGAKVVKLQKTYTVTPNNALFRYAYIAMIENPSHSCCQQPGVQIKVTITNTATGQPTLLACPQVSIAAGTACGSAAPGFTTGITIHSGPANYNPAWVPSSIDLSAYIGFQVNLDVYAIDCSQSGHTGYVYFDALCAPMTIIGNGSGFPAGTPNITLPTCGASGATITAPPGLGPYTWTSSAITVPGNLSVPSLTNTTLLTNQSGTVQLTMNPAGSCAPIIKVITVTITPAPQALISMTQAGCTNTIACVSLTTAGSASVTSNIIWTPTPNSLTTNSLNACGFPPGTGTVTVFDTFSCQITNTFNINAAPPVPTFTVSNNPSTFTLSCLNPAITLNATSSYTYGSLNYNWINSPPTLTSTTNSITVTNGNTGSYTVTATDPLTNCTVSQTFAIGQNTAVPVNVVNPVSQIINCNTGAVTFTSTISSPTVNTTTYWYYPGATYTTAPSFVSNNSVSIGAPTSPGTATILTVNNVNGCSNTKTVQITSTSAFPTINVTSSTNFTLGCAPQNTTNLCVTGTSTNGPVQYALLPPSSTFTVPYSSSLFSGTNCTITTVPGTWTFVVRDPISGCQTPLPVVILSQIAAPNVLAAMPTQTLTCNNPSVLAVGSSSTANTTVGWLIPSSPFSLPTPTITIGTLTGPSTNTALPNPYAIYTVVATNSVSSCISTQTIQIYQNFWTPKAIGVAYSNPANITCNNQCVSLTFTNATLSYTGGISIPSNTWTSPPPALNTSFNSTVSACYVGIYTLTVKDSQNGCISNTAIPVALVENKPVLASLPTFTIDCSATGSLTAAKIQISLTSTVQGWSILMTEVPNPTPGFSNLQLTQPPFGATVAATALNYTFTVDQPGYYEFVVRNLTTGCTELGSFVVVSGGLNANFSADPSTGFAPLNVNFTNLSSSSSTATGTQSITTNWAFGNGTTALQTTSASANPSTIYNNPGTYTVTMLSRKGSCVDSTYKIIRVELPSKLEIPNVFTPNGDGNNDVFFLKTSTLTEINALIFDRWGNKVYDLTSSTGNIAWDGKNQEGKECAAGTYFYIIKATGKDGSTYDKKGTVSLYR